MAIEDLIDELEASYTIVTHNMQQAARISDRTAFFTSQGRRSRPARRIRDTAKIFSPSNGNPLRTTPPDGSADPGIRRRAQ